MPILIDGTAGITLSGSAGFFQVGNGGFSLANTINVMSGGTGSNTLTGVVKGNGINPLTAGKVDLSTEISGTLNVASGGTGLTSPGTSGNVLVSTGTAWISQAQPNRYNASVISSNTNASAGIYYVATAVLTLTLPGSPSVGDYVGFTNPTVNTTSVIARNTANISGLAEDLIVDKANTSLVLMYSGVNKGWVFV